MRRLLAALAALPLVALSAIFAVVPTAQAVGPCEDSRVFVESQAWWAPTPGTTGGNDFGHVHLGACIPERDTISAVTTIPVRVILHHNPGTLRDLSVVFKTTNSETTVAKLVPPRRTCPVSETCEINMTATIDPAKFDRRGLQEIRFRAFVDEPDGKQMHTSLNFQAHIENGKTLSNVTRNPYLRSKGWYTNFGYCEPDFLSVPVPDAPISGTWSFSVKQVDHGSGDVDPTHHTVALDANAHAGIPGTILKSGPGPLPATTFSVDTTTLSNGTHRLAQRVDCASGNQTNSGVQVIVLEVFNPVPEPSPTPTVTETPTPTETVTPTVEPTPEPTPTAPTTTPVDPTTTPTCGG